MKGLMLGRGSIRLLVAAICLAGLVNGTGAAAAGSSSVVNTVHLRVLVLSDGSTNVTAIAAQLHQEGVPTTVVDTAAGSGPVITRAFLADDSTHTARFQGVVLPGASALSATDQATLAGFERDYGIREVVAYAFPNADVGMTAPTYSGSLDGGALTLAPGAASAGFGYLSGQLPIDDVDPAISEVYGYLASGLDTEPTGGSYLPLIQAKVGDATGSVIGVNTVNGRSRMIITAAFGAHQRYFQEIGHGIITWLTRGIHLGYQRNYFAVHVDDVFMADSQWSPEGRCTPGDDCYGEAAHYTTPDIRMLPADVTHAVSWQQQSGITLDMVFNGGGSADYLADNPQLTSDPLVTAFAAHIASFGWVNHTYNHEYLGCIEVAPPTAGDPWHCATPADRANPATVYIEPELAANHAEFDPGSGLYFLTAGEISDQITRNRTWAAQHGFPINESELVTGEHSGLAISPQQPIDNPNLAPTLAADKIGALASDASREAGSRVVGSARTVPRHPMNIFYNVDSYLGEVSEYNWYYTSVADGGGGACERQPEITQCISPLPDATEQEAESSFHSYILPIEVRNALSFVLSNDPRPFYVHQSNLTDQRIVYPVLDGIVAGYRSVFDAATTPMVHLTMSEQAAAMARMTAWDAAEAGTDATIDATGVHVTGGGGADIPITMPTGATVSGMTVSAYGGEKSGWIAAGTGAAVTIGLTTTAAGYIGVPQAPTIASATAGNNSATVTWTPAPDRGSPVTGYTVRAYVGANIDVAATLGAPADATSLVVTGLINFAPYSFTVTADSAGGSSDPSARSVTVIPAPSVPAAPAIVSAGAGDGTATLTWQAPTDGGSPVTLYTVRLYPAGSDIPAISQDVAANQQTATFTGLSNGAGFSMDVFAYNIVGAGPASARSAVVTPQAPSVTTTTSSSSETATTSASPSSSTAVPPPPPPPPPPPSSSPSTTTSAPSGARVPGVVRVTSLTPGNASVTVRWAAPADGGSPITGYVVAIYRPRVAPAVRTIAVAANIRSLKVTELINGVGYQFTVQAINAVGAGRASGRSRTVIPRGTAPGQPKTVVATSGPRLGPGTAVVRWTVPRADGGSLVTGFVVVALRLDASGHVRSTRTERVRTSSARALAMSLSSGHYRFTVRAVNRYGMGRSSVPSNVVLVR